MWLDQTELSCNNLVTVVNILKICSFLQCTKNKTWKDTAAQLGIGASSSGAYTLKKHYGKNLLAYECQFDRGGMDPGPILAQVEGQMKKKAKASLSQPPPAPSPGSQDSRDSYSNSSDPYSSGYPMPGANSVEGPPGKNLGSGMRFTKLCCHNFLF